MTDNIFSSFKMSEKNPQEISPISLAFLGDGVHTLFVRERVLSLHDFGANKLHTESARFCRASKQAETIDALMPSLTEDEKDVVRRARNAKVHHIVKNTDKETYQKATSFEALVGFLFLTHQNKRLEEVLEISIKDEK